MHTHTQDRQIYSTNISTKPLYKFICQLENSLHNMNFITRRMESKNKTRNQIICMIPYFSRDLFLFIIIYIFLKEVFFSSSGSLQRFGLFCWSRSHIAVTKDKYTKQKKSAVTFFYSLCAHR